jgi:hypothetical protein
MCVIIGALNRRARGSDVLDDVLEMLDCRASAV